MRASEMETIPSTALRPFQRKPMPTRYVSDHAADSRTDPQEVKFQAAVTRRELLIGAASAGAALALNSESAFAKTSPASQLLVGAAKRVITPNPLLPVSGGMGPTRPTREKK